MFTIANRGTGSEEVIHDNLDGLLTRIGSGDLIEALRRFKTDESFVARATQLAIKDCSLRFDHDVNFAEIFALATSGGKQ